MGHYATQCPLKKKGKDEKHDLKATPAKIEEEFAMTAEIPPRGRWANLELYFCCSGYKHPPKFWLAPKFRDSLESFT